MCLDNGESTGTAHGCKINVSSTRLLSWSQQQQLAAQFHVVVVDMVGFSIKIKSLTHPTAKQH
jgi:hypothetical protein